MLSSGDAGGGGGDGGGGEACHAGAVATQKAMGEAVARVGAGVRFGLELGLGFRPQGRAVCRAVCGVVGVVWTVWLEHEHPGSLRRHTGGVCTSTNPGLRRPQPGGATERGGVAQCVERSVAGGVGAGWPGGGGMRTDGCVAEVAVTGSPGGTEGKARRARGTEGKARRAARVECSGGEGTGAPGVVSGNSGRGSGAKGGAPQRGPGSGCSGGAPRLGADSGEGSGRAPIVGACSGEGSGRAPVVGACSGEGSGRAPVVGAGSAGGPREAAARGGLISTPPACISAIGARRVTRSPAAVALHVWSWSLQLSDNMYMACIARGVCVAGGVCEGGVCVEDSGSHGNAVSAAGIISDVLEGEVPRSRPVVTESPEPAARPMPERPHCAAAASASQIGPERLSMGLRKSSLAIPCAAQNLSAAAGATGQRNGLCSYTEPDGGRPGFASS